MFERFGESITGIGEGRSSGEEESRPVGDICEGERWSLEGDANRLLLMTCLRCVFKRVMVSER
jgi:hypothetical protein